MLDVSGLVEPKRTAADVFCYNESMTDELNHYVRTDEHGVMRVADTHVMLDSVVAAFDQGHSPESIRSQYPSLSLEQVYGAITYYLGHREQVESYLRRQDAEWARWRAVAEQRQAPVVERLRAMKASGAERAT